MVKRWFQSRNLWYTQQRKFKSKTLPNEEHTLEIKSVLEKKGLITLSYHF